MDILLHLYNNREFTDLTVLCGQDKHLLHRNIVIPQAPVFRHRLHHLFAPCNDGSFVLKTTDPESFRFFVRFLYLEDYTRGPFFPRATAAEQKNGKTASGVVVDPDTSQPASNMMAHLKLYYLAIDFECSALQELAKTKFLVLVTLYGHTPWFVEVVEYIFSATADAEMREVALRGIAQHRTWQLSDKAEKLIFSLGISHDVLKRVDEHLRPPLKRPNPSPISGSTRAAKTARR